MLMMNIMYNLVNIIVEINIHDKYYIHVRIEEVLMSAHEYS